MNNEQTAQLIDTVSRWSLQYREGGSRTAVQQRIGLTQLVKRQLGRHYWLPWMVGKNLDPLSCDDVKASVFAWGNRLEQLCHGGAIAESTARAMWDTARSWHRWLHETGRWSCPMPDVYWQRPAWDFLQPQPRRQVRTLTAAQLRTLLESARTMPGREITRLRTRAVLAVLIATGCRISEIAAARRIDLRITRSRGGELTVRVKGGWRRTLTLPPWACPIIQGYLQHRDTHGTGLMVGEEPLIASTAAIGGRWRHASASALASQILTAARAGGIEQHVHPHAIRHTMISDALSAGFDPYDVRAWSGHARTSSLDHYDHRQRGERVAAHLHARIGGNLAG